MNHYLIGVKKYFGGEETFEVEAYDRTDAGFKAQDILKTDPVYCVGGNYDIRTIRIIKKLQK